MKGIIYRKTTSPAFEVEARIDIEAPLSNMSAGQFESMTTVMELSGLTDSAISQGMDVQLKERSYRNLINMGRAVPVDEIEVVDYTNNASFVEYTRLAIVATDDSAEDIDGGSGEDGVLNVLDNDTLDGDAVTLSTVTLSEISNDSGGDIVLAADGDVNVAPSTAADTYNIVYQISEIANPANVDTATVQITVV
jgi:hypothetical protein